jgi:hypothetical protein
MTTDEKLTAILAAVQIDPGNRGLGDLFAFSPGDFAAACRGIADQPHPGCIVTFGFFIPGGSPPTFETDGPLGVAFLFRAFHDLGIAYFPHGEDDVRKSLRVALERIDVPSIAYPKLDLTHFIAVERSGPASDGRHYTMRGRDISEFMTWNFKLPVESLRTIGIGDGGNEIGMGKIPHETIVKNIPNGDLIHCRVPTDHLIVAGVSNWGAYALAAGVYVLRGLEPPRDLFDPDCEREILEVMVREGPLVDGVTGKQTATVDGLTWEEYVKPLIRIREILGS